MSSNSVPVLFLMSVAIAGAFVMAVYAAYKVEPPTNDNITIIVERAALEAYCRTVEE